MSRQLVEEHWDDEDIKKNRFKWWSKKLAWFVQERKALQQSTLSVNGQKDIKEIRENLKQIYLRIKDQLDEAELELWEDLIGFYFGRTDVSTGFNAIGMMSVEWWQQRAKRVDFFLRAARKRIQDNEYQEESHHQITIWEDLKEYTDAAYLLVKEQMDRADKEGKWWHRVFNDINHYAYTTPEWYAMDWIFHKGWGTSVIEELNELEKSDKTWDEDIWSTAIDLSKSICVKNTPKTIYFKS